MVTFGIKLNVLDVAKANRRDAPDLASGYGVDPGQDHVAANGELLAVAQRGKRVQRFLAAFR